MQTCTKGYHYIVLSTKYEGNYDTLLVDIHNHKISSEYVIANGSGNEKRLNQIQDVLGMKLNACHMKVPVIWLELLAGSNIGVYYKEYPDIKGAYKIEHNIPKIPGIRHKYGQQYEVHITNAIENRAYTLGTSLERIMLAYPIFYGWLTSLMTKGDVFVNSYMERSWSKWPESDKEFANHFFAFKKRKGYRNAV